MTNEREIVITGVGVVSPIGIGAEAFWESLRQGRAGVRQLDLLDGSDLRPPLGGNIPDFDPKVYVRPRKSLKVMSRDIQLAFAASDMACQQSGLAPGAIAPERLGVVFGADMITCDLDELRPAFAGSMEDGRFNFARWGESALAQMYPLWMLKYLPNMPACHVGIAQDARGPNNTLTLGEASSLAAVAEAARIIERGQADAMITGGAGCRIHPAVWAYRRAYHFSERVDNPAEAMRPFDADRDGTVHGEGAGALVLESRGHAEARGATILARIGRFASGFEPRRPGNQPKGQAIRQAICQVLEGSGLAREDIEYVNAHGASTPLEDRIEAQAIRDTLGDVPVTALKSYFGSLGAGGGAVELIASVLAFGQGEAPPTLNYHTPDPECPVNVIHHGPMRLDKGAAIVLNQSRIVQSMALLLLAP
ncbi:MAG: beta-ketoacyl-[acyl-carrier-protein] synthase family protein [Pirellulales bacterium]|nr:beta-ketoacyl-[acyl-carrier-protein] synthase family protein [Pirellulales bacterium]